MNASYKGKSGSVTNQYGVTITMSELNRLNKAIPQANKIIGAEKRRRIKLHKSVEKYGEFSLDLRKDDIERFRTKEAFKNYLRVTESIAKGTYFNQRAIQYRKNYIKALEINFGPDAKSVINKIKRMPISKFRDLAEGGIIENLGYIYYESAGDAQDILDSITAVIQAANKSELPDSKYNAKKQRWEMEDNELNRQVVKELEKAGRIKVINTKK